MRNVTFALVLVIAGAAAAERTRSKEAAAAAKAALDKADELFNAHDAKGIGALLDKSYFGAGPTVSSRVDSPEAMIDRWTTLLAKGGRFIRGAVTIKADDDGGAAWYVADYTFIPKVPPGALPMRRPMRESGVLVKRGKEWKFAMTHMSMLQLDEVAPPTSAAPVQKYRVRRSGCSSRQYVGGCGFVRRSYAAGWARDGSAAVAGACDHVVVSPGVDMSARRARAPICAGCIGARPATWQ